LVKHIDRNSDFILVFSAYWMKNLIEMGVNEEKIDILPHGYDDNVFMKLDKAICRDNLKLKRDDFIILNSNRNTYRKCLDITIAAFLRFYKMWERDDIKLFLNSHFEGGCTDIYNIIKIECIKLGLDYDKIVDNHIFKLPTSGFISDKQLNELYNACDIGINTCGGEGFGLCNVEHGVLGKPQIVSSVGALRDIFKDSGATLIEPKASFYTYKTLDGHGGYFYICDPDEFASAINKYYINREKIYEDGMKIQNTLYEKYKWDNILTNFKNYF
jgi:glycosyltransferase involved in cell wall biosynthesis